MVNRRNFLAGISALVGGLAVEQAIPLGRVWSFPTQIIRPDFNSPDWIMAESLRLLKRKMPFEFYEGRAFIAYDIENDCHGLTIQARQPHRFTHVRAVLPTEVMNGTNFIKHILEPATSTLANYVTDRT